MGAPVGVQIECAAETATGRPLVRTRVAPVIQRPVTQGPSPTGGLKGQPEIA